MNTKANNETVAASAGDEPQRVKPPTLESACDDVASARDARQCSSDYRTRRIPEVKLTHEQMEALHQLQEQLERQGLHLTKPQAIGWLLDEFAREANSRATFLRATREDQFARAAQAAQADATHTK